MNGSDAQGWAILIAAVAAAITSIIAALKSNKANQSAVAAQDQTALNHQTIQRVESKLDENTQLTSSVASQVVEKMNGSAKCKAEALAQKLVPPKDGIG